MMWLGYACLGVGAGGLVSLGITFCFPGFLAAAGTFIVDWGAYLALIAMRNVRKNEKNERN
jgi:hypothetical protein